MGGMGLAHRVKYRKLGRTTSHRLAMLRTMVDQLIEHERIKTTVPKAKELRRFADWVINLGRNGDEPSRRRAQGILRTEASHNKVFDILGPKYQNRPSGFTRIMQIGHRKGDNADMCIIELVDRKREVRPPKPVSEQTVDRNSAHRMPRFRDLLPSRDWANDPHFHQYLNQRPEHRKDPLAHLAHMKEAQTKK